MGNSCLIKFTGAAVLGLLLSAQGCSGSGSSSSSSVDNSSDNVDNSGDNTAPAPSTEVVYTTEEFQPHWPDTGIFSSAASCGDCHSASTGSSGVLRYPATAAGEDISPYATRQHSVMGNAYNDPYFRAKVQDEVIQFPELAGTIEDKCLTCHAPMAHTNAHATGIVSNDACPSGDGCYRMAEADQEMMAREGVSCTLCHQIDGDNLEGAFSGNYPLDPDALTVYGPYFDVRSQPMSNNTQYAVAGSAHIQESKLCASCHDLNTPSVNVSTGELTGRNFVEQSPYREWRNSNFSSVGSEIHCQSCHMPTIDGYSTALARTPGGHAAPGWPQRDDYSQHTFLGGNTYLLELLKNYRDELGIANTTSVEGFDSEIAKVEQFVSLNSATLIIEKLELSNSQLDIDVNVVNLTGHKLPTSYPSRRLWLALSVTDSMGEILFTSGIPDSDGYLAMDTRQTAPTCVEVDNRDGYVENDCYSAHYNVITAKEQVQVYETVMGDTSGYTTYMLLYADSYLKDNRIPPAGFKTQGKNYTPEIAIFGAATSDPDFNRNSSIEGSGSDTVHYQLPWRGLPSNDLKVEVTLYYQSLKPAFVSGLQHNGERIDHFRSMYDKHKPRAMVLQQVGGDIR